MTKTASSGSRLGWVLLEAGLIVLGLGAGWLVTEWQAERERDREAAQARAAIASELAENRIRIAEARDYHAGIVGALGGYLYGGRTGEPDLLTVFEDGFVHPAEVYTVAWETAGQTGALADFSAEERNAFADAYARLDQYRDAGSEIGGIIYRAIFDEGLEGVFANWRGVVPIASTLLYQECTVLEVLDGLRSTEGMDETLFRALPEDPGAEACTRMVAR